MKREGWRRLRDQGERDTAWVMGAPASLSFATVCELLNLDPDAVQETYFSRPPNAQGKARRRAWV